MASYRLVLVKQVRKKDLPKIPPKDRDRIVSAIEKLQNNPKPPQAKKLTNREEYSLRQGGYRILYVIEEEVKIIEVRHVAKRGRVYR